MNFKTFMGKNVMFVAIIIFIVLFMYAFGSENVLIGVMMITAALMMLSKNLTGKPVKSLAGLVGINVTLGIGSLLASFNPWLGLITNFTVVFGVTFVLMHDIKSPVHFPFLLGYAFILAAPVPLADFPLRLLALIVGSVFILALNLLVNRQRLAMSCHAGICGIFTEVRALTEKVINGEEVSSETLIAKAKLVNSAVYDRLNDKYYSSPGSRSAINLAISAEELGKAIIAAKDRRQDLEDLLPVLDTLIAYQESKVPLTTVHQQISDFTKTHENINYQILASLRIINHEMAVLLSTDKETLRKYSSSQQIPRSFRFVTLLKENFRKDSLKYSFAFRMALLIALWEFIGDYWHLENAKWLAFTTVAVVQPYLEATVSKSFLRLKGTLVGVAIFAAVTYFLLTDHPDLAPAVLMVISYIYSVFDPKRYDIMMIFITLMALLTASMVFPAESSIIERLLYILAGIAAAMIGSRVIYPYRLKDKNIELSRRYLSISRSQLNNLQEVAAGTIDDVKNAALVLTAHTIAEKIKLNNDQDADEVVDELLVSQTEFTNQCALLRQTLLSTPHEAAGLEETKKRTVEAISRHGPKGKEPTTADMAQLTADLSPHGREYLQMVFNVLRLQRESEALFLELSSPADLPTGKIITA